ncbi:MAG: ABC transporter ATP-binding protein [Planctomycetes bacterium]|nr:ABC transporter ATP-binding protein [Planctomycetota bacterium]MCH8119017.1 ABC transporter ATP-binding protein [Planctomycetota bacterium]
MLSVKNISKSLGTLAIRDVSFEVQPGQYFVLLGASGAGKSVLLETIAGLIWPDAGRIFLDGRDVTDEKIQKRKFGLVFQNSALFPHMTVYDNIAYSLRCKGLKNSQIQERVDRIAEDFAVTGFLKRRVQTLSGGESQRISLARAVASEPRCLLLDEPISSLDAKSRPQIRALLRKINRQGQTIVHVTHDYTEAVSLGTHIAVMDAGRIAQAGTVEEVFQRPKSEFIARFVGIRNFFKGQLEKPVDGPANLRQFVADGLGLSVMTDSVAGIGFVMVRSEDVTICSAAMNAHTSARNNFEGTIVDIIPAATGIEVLIDVGAGKPVEVAAMISAESVKSLELHCGKRVWISFKASAARYVEQ